MSLPEQAVDLAEVKKRLGVDRFQRDETLVDRDGLVVSQVLLRFGLILEVEFGLNRQAGLVIRQHPAERVLYGRLRVARQVGHLTGQNRGGKP